MEFYSNSAFYHFILITGKRIHVIGGQSLETSRPVPVSEFFDSETGVWEEDFRFRKGTKRNVFISMVWMSSDK